MENKNKNEELQSRREFFKSAAKAALPVLAVAAFGTTLLTSCDENQPSTSSNGCNGCSGSCSSSCSGGCEGGCSGGCDDNCTAACWNSCNKYLN